MVATSRFLALCLITNLAQRAEAALFDSIFVADQLALGGHEFFRRRALGWSRSSL